MPNPRPRQAEGTPKGKRLEAEAEKFENDMQKFLGFVTAVAIDLDDTREDGEDDDDEDSYAEVFFDDGHVTEKVAAEDE